MEFSTKEYITALVAIIFGIFYYSSWKLSYWKRKGVPGPTPIPFFGNFPGVFFNRISIGETIDKIYKEWKHEPFIGVYKGQSAQLIIHDLELIKTILIRDFSTFSGRGAIVNEDVDPLSAHLINIDGPRWKAIRTKLTPTFTAGKLRHMVELMIDCANHFEKYLKVEVEKNNIIDCREAAAKFTTDIIGSCAFGINMNALSREDSEFRIYGKKIWESSFATMMTRLIREISPWLYRVLKLQMNSTEVTQFFLGSINETVAMRKRDKIVRHDMIDLFIEIQKTEINNKDVEYTDSILAAQAFVFFAAGFETSSATIAFALYELALNPKVQEKLRKNIIDILKQHNNQLSYDALNNMKYLDMVVQEALRKHSPVSTLIRKAYKPYIIPGTKITIEKGTFVNIPVDSLHYDPNSYPEPEIFDPERFSEENKAKLHSMAHLPFGDGPKNCIGGRFADYQVKLGLVKILKNYILKPSESTFNSYKIDPGCFILTPKSGIKLIFEPLD